MSTTVITTVGTVLTALIAAIGSYLIAKTNVRLNNMEQRQQDIKGSLETTTGDSLASIVETGVAGVEDIAKNGK